MWPDFHKDYVENTLNNVCSDFWVLTGSVPVLFSMNIAAFFSFSVKFQL